MPSLSPKIEPIVHVYVCYRLLQKCCLVQSAKVLERDMQRGELNKVKQGQAEVSYDMEGTREEIHKLTQQINLAEQQLNRVSIYAGENLRSNTTIFLANLRQIFNIPTMHAFYANLHMMTKI